MSSRPPVRGNHSISMGAERERHRKSPIDVVGGTMSSTIVSQHRRSPTQLHHHKRSPRNSRTPSPNLDNLRTAANARERGRNAHSGNGVDSSYHHTTSSSSSIKSPRSAFTAPAHSDKSSKNSSQKRRNSPVLGGTITSSIEANRKAGTVRRGSEKRRGSPVSEIKTETSVTPKRREIVVLNEETDDGPDAELESIASGLSQNKHTAKNKGLWQPPKSLRPARPRSEPQHQQRGGAPSSPGQKKNSTRRSSLSSASEATEQSWIRPKKGNTSSSANKDEAQPPALTTTLEPKLSTQENEDDESKLRILLQRVLQQRDQSEALDELADIEHLQEALECRRQQVLSTKTSLGTKSKISNKKSDKAAQINESELINEEMLQVDPELASLHSAVQDIPPVTIESSVSTDTYQNAIKENQEEIKQQKDAATTTNTTTRAERLARLHASAKAPTDHMFSSAYDSTQRLLIRGRAKSLLGSRTSTNTNQRYDVDRRAEIRERSRQREQEYLREMNHYNSIQSIRSTISSPETVISSISDYSAWSCPSPKSPNQIEFSYQPPPSFVPRIRLEALRSTKDKERTSLDKFVHLSPDPNKSVSSLYSPCSAFTPRSSNGSDFGQHRNAFIKNNIKGLFPSAKPKNNNNAPPSSSSSTSAATVALPTNTTHTVGEIAFSAATASQQAFSSLSKNESIVQETTSPNKVKKKTSS
mmetsp:Transcript_17449/g.26245  ORF Transcript_17449/g.26245 Transcript_17449/m.26245 type:complete len:701 (-) Transcript_17449:1230-3332(-)